MKRPGPDWDVGRGGADPGAEGRLAAHVAGGLGKLVTMVGAARGEWAKAGRKRWEKRKARGEAREGLRTIMRAGKLPNIAAHSAWRAPQACPCTPARPA